MYNFGDRGLVKTNKIEATRQKPKMFFWLPIYCEASHNKVMINRVRNYYK